MLGKINNILNQKEEQKQGLEAINSQMMSLGRDLLSYCHKDWDTATRNTDAVVLLREFLTNLSNAVTTKEDIDRLH